VLMCLQERSNETGVSALLHRPQDPLSWRESVKVPLSTGQRDTQVLTVTNGSAERGYVSIAVYSDTEVESVPIAWYGQGMFLAWQCPPRSTTIC
jgi:hypothetical protein